MIHHSPCPVAGCAPRPRRGVVQITGSEKLNYFMPGLAGPDYMDVGGPCTEETPAWGMATAMGPW